MELSDNEKAIINVCRMNKAEKRIEIRERFNIGRLEVDFSWRSKKNLWGRFGGGWNWKLGFQSSGRNIIFSLLVCELSFYFKKREV
jgi:hypothetical protein